MSYYQIPDKFEYKNDIFLIKPYLLRQYFKEHPERRINKSQVEFLSSSHHRLYIAHFKINEKKLEIVDFKFRTGRNNYKPHLDETFPYEHDKKLTWFTGIILLASDDLKAYHNHIMLRDHKSYIILEIENGILIKELSLNQMEFSLFKKDQLEKFKLTKEYEDERNKIIRLLEGRNRTRNKEWKFNEEEILNKIIMRLPFLAKKIL